MNKDPHLKSYICLSCVNGLNEAFIFKRKCDKLNAERDQYKTEKIASWETIVSTCCDNKNDTKNFPTTKLLVEQQIKIVVKTIIIKYPINVWLWLYIFISVYFIKIAIVNVYIWVFLGRMKREWGTRRDWTATCL